MPPQNSDTQKPDLRKKYRDARHGIDDLLRGQYNHVIRSQIVAFVIQQKAQNIAGYLAFDGEPDITHSLLGLNESGIDVHLPVIAADPSGKTMIFRRWLPLSDSTLRKNHYGIEEPVIGEEISPDGLDIIFIPLVAFDEDGGRLGMGAGYYDRALESVAEHTKPLRIGIAYEAQCVPAIPMNENDVRLHGIITEKGLIDCNELLAV